MAAYYGKQEARRVVQERLRGISDEEYGRLSVKVYANIVAWLSAEATIHTALTYHALPKWREVDISNLRNEFETIHFESVSSGAGAPLPTKKYDIIFVPFYGFTKNGYRLGHGGGWYDRLLTAQPQAIKVGIGLAVAQIDFITELHDVRMDIGITENATISF